MLRMRSTSPPKSAWPGVSTILMRRVVPDQRGHLGEDGDAALALEVVGIHRPLGDALVFAEGAGLLQQPVDQGGLAMVDMGDDGDVAKVHGAVFVGLKSATGPTGPACVRRNIVSRDRGCNVASG